jgi:hypothetical protein
MLLELECAARGANWPKAACQIMGLCFIAMTGMVSGMAGQPASQEDEGGHNG